MSMRRIKGEKIELAPLTRELCREFWMDYAPDLDMDDRPYTFDEAWVEKYFAARSADESRRIFSVVFEGHAIGEVSLKRIDLLKRCATMSIVLCNDEFKGRGFGSEAERLIIGYGFTELGVSTIYADTVIRNHKSQHVLIKLGFTEIDRDSDFIYYRFDRQEWRQ